MSELLILMAAYNNARFLRPQLDSILSQTIADWRLLVRDDGSTDETGNILREYAARDSRIACVWNTTPERGAYDNFHTLIRMAKERNDYRYVVFSDADDVWRKDRLERLLLVAEKEKKDDLPRFFYSDFSLIDQDGTVTCARQSERMALTMPSRWTLMFHRDKVWGCTSMANRALIERVGETPALDIHRVAHDAYLANYAQVYGECVYVDEPLVYYRRHGGNASGFSHGGPRKTFEKVFDMSAPKATMAATFFQSIQTLDEMLSNDPGNESLSKVRDLLKRGGPRACLFCLKEGIHRYRWDKTMAFYALLLTRRYCALLSKEMVDTL